MLICEDMWFYSLPMHLKKNKADLFICINASPYETDKFLHRKVIAKKLLKKTKIPLIYLNQVGGQDELVFDGNSFFMDNKGNILEKCNPWKEEFKTIIPGIKVYTTLDTRWNNPDIKTTQLLPNVLAKTKGIKNGFGEALFLDKNSYITEGSSSNFWILNKRNILVTRSLDGKILAGITRDSILNCAKNKNIKVEEKKISLDNIKNCKEAFITSASSFVTPVIQVDNIKINNGKVGEFSNLLRKTYLELND